MDFDVVRTDGLVDEYRDDGHLFDEYGEHVDGSEIVHATHGKLMGPRHNVRHHHPYEARNVVEP